MSRRTPVVAVVVALFAFGPALASWALEGARGASGPGTPLGRGALTDERPPPQAAQPLSVRPAPRGDSPLLDIPLRTRYPSGSFLPGLPEVGLFPPGDSLAETDETQLVRLIYDTYSRYSERSDGERVEFELDDFRTFYRPQFDQVAHYPDVMTLGTEWEIRTTIRSHGVNDVQTVRYDAEWLPIESRAERMPHLMGKSVLEILELVVEALPAQRRIVAITSYRVQVSYLGRSKEYRASVRWQIDERQELVFSVVDNVVPEVGLAVTETSLPAGRLVRPEAPLPFDRVVGATTTTSCTAQTWPDVHSSQKADYNSFGHLDGRHEAVYIGKFTCSCESSCLSRCTAGFVASSCQDYGRLSGDADLEHRANRRVETSDGQQVSGHQTAASCVSGLGCFVQSCPGGACGSITVQASIGVGSISFSTTAPTILNASFDAKTTCGLCTEIEDDPPDEPSGPMIQDGGESGGGSTSTGTSPTEGSPIVVDLDRGGFRFSDLAGGVRFDLDGDGARERMAWIAAGAGDGWLALDRDGDGAIGSGAELFGDFTPQPPAAEPHGYLALAVYDGDGDRAITAADAVFGELRIWLDADHDGTSQPGELSPLAAWGIVALELDVAESRRRDAHGNELRYAARVRLDDGATQSADVFLLRE